MMARMLRPSSDNDAQGPMTLTRHILESSATSASSTSSSSALACGSSVTVTFVSEVEIRSTESPWDLNTAKASARKPTWCHMPGLSIETSVMPRRIAIAFTWAPLSAGWALMIVPASSGLCVAKMYSGMRACRAGRMQRGCSTLAPWVAISCASS